MADVSVAGLAFDFSKDSMASMGEKDMVRLSVDPFPQEFLFLLFKLPDFFLFGTLGGGLLMTFEAGG